MDTAPTRPPVLSTPDTRLAETTTDGVVSASTIPDAQFAATYELERTVTEIRNGGWRRVALQFPDNLLPDAPRVYRWLRDRLLDDPRTQDPEIGEQTSSTESETVLFILGDTSYSACCVDEIAAEHVDADVVVHYGRACLSPTARLPVIYVFTAQPLEHTPVIEVFESTYPDKDIQVIIVADTPYINHVPSLVAELRDRGYQSLYETSIVHNPSSLIPNRTVPSSDSTDLKSWALFHIAQPPQALQLTLASRVASIHIYPIPLTTTTTPTALQASTTLALRRRYALLVKLSRASIIGILVNTLSIHAYQEALEGTQARIAAAGKKSYVFAMGRLNSAKIANFAEVDGWVVLGCWESSLIENTEFDKPVVAPFELELALQSDQERIWTGEWRGDFTNMTIVESSGLSPRDAAGSEEHDRDTNLAEEGWQQLNSDSESEPPEFDLRTGRYIMSSRPMARKTNGSKYSGGAQETTNTLARRPKGDLAVIGGELSPGAQFLRDKRTWRGLGSDFEIAYEEENGVSTAIKEGRSGIARGYENEKSG